MSKRIALIAAMILAVACVGKSADLDKLPNPTKNMKVGQWVSYKSMGGGNTKQSITAIEGSGEDMVFTVKTEMTMAGNAMPEQEQTIPVKGMKEMQEQAWGGGADVKVSNETVSAGGRNFDATVIEFTNQGMTTKIWMSEEVPVTCIVKMEVQGMPEPIMELVEFGG